MSNVFLQKTNFHTDKDCARDLDIGDKKKGTVKNSPFNQVRFCPDYCVI